MRLSISNLSWDKSELNVVLSTLKKHNIGFIETVLTKINNWDELNLQAVKEFKKTCLEFDIRTSSLQSLFYNTKIESFADFKSVSKHLENIISYAVELDAKFLVLGSPSLRKFDSILGLSKSLKLIDSILKKTNIILCLEPNCKIYGGSYFFSLDEICEFIKQNKFKNIKTMIDTHNLLEEGFDLCEEYASYIDNIYHVHISEKGLGEIKSTKKYDAFLDELKNDFDGFVVYEFNNCKNFEKSIVKFKEMF
jgi:sugar phosphate isomerase/epimerase